MAEISKSRDISALASVARVLLLSWLRQRLRRRVAELKRVGRIIGLAGLFGCGVTEFLWARRCRAMRD